MSSSGDSAGAETASTTVAVICGPTAAGKSGVAMALAARRPLTIISADSRQVYKGFDIGTAKPTAEDMRRVPHRGVDVVEPTQRFSAAAWADLATAAIAEARAAGRIPVIVGGTGFYVRALFEPLFQEPALDESRRHGLQRAMDGMETGELRRWCERLDPPRARFGRAQLVRAVEVALLTGRRLSALHVERARPAAFRASYLLVDPGPVLASWIATRAAAMFDAGWTDEVRRLVRDVPADAPAWRASGYDAMRRHVRGELGRDATLERVIIETRQYAKRQRTWFRNQLRDEDVRTVAPAASDRTWEADVEAWITGIEAGERGAERR